jgi:hypothetical protein
MADKRVVDITIFNDKNKWHGKNSINIYKHLVETTVNLPKYPI